MEQLDKLQVCQKMLGEKKFSQKKRRSFRENTKVRRNKSLINNWKSEPINSNLNDKTDVLWKKKEKLDWQKKCFDAQKRCFFVRLMIREKQKTIFTQSSFRFGEG